MNNKLLSKNYIFLVISATLFYTVSFMMNSVSVKAVTDNGGSDFTAGVVTAVFTMASFFTRPFWGWITDKKGRTLVYKTGALLAVFSAVLLFFETDILFLTISRIILGTGYSALTTAGGTIVCDNAPESKLQQAIAVYGITNVASQAAGPVMALWLYKAGFSQVVVFSCIMCVAVLLLAMFIRYDESRYTDSSKKFILYYNKALPAAYTILFFAMVTSAVNSFVPKMAQQRNLTADSMFFVVSAVFLLLARISNKKVSAGIGNVKMFYAGSVIYGVAFVLLAITSTDIVLITAAAFYGLGAGFIHPVVNTAAVKNCPDRHRGLATGTFMMSQDLGMTAGSFLWGFISGKWNFCRVYFTSVFLIAVMIFVFRKVLALVVE